MCIRDSLRDGRCEPFGDTGFDDQPGDSGIGQGVGHGGADGLFVVGAT